jgi:GNAT superfamily N-acetyltransferase
MSAATGMIRWGAECVRTGSWRTDASVAFVSPVTDAPPPSAEFVRRCLRLLGEKGFQGVVTAALSPEEQRGFLDAGFTVHEQLHLLLLEKSVALPPLPPRPGLRRAGWLRTTRALEVDALAFSAFWRFDRAGLKEAIAATPESRFRVALGKRGSVLGYAICGAACGRGFVQRLAVAPAAQGHGIGRKLLLDGLHWLRRVGTFQVAVNTQMGNEAALSLYRSVGFHEDPRGLCVLSTSLDGPGVRAAGSGSRAREGLKGGAP